MNMTKRSAKNAFFVTERRSMHVCEMNTKHSAVVILNLRGEERTHDIEVQDRRRYRQATRAILVLINWRIRTISHTIFEKKIFASAIS